MEQGIMAIDVLDFNLTCPTRICFSQSGKNGSKIPFTPKVALWQILRKHLLMLLIDPQRIIMGKSLISGIWGYIPSI